MLAPLIAIAPGEPGEQAVRVERVDRDLGHRAVGLDAVLDGERLRSRSARRTSSAWRTSVSTGKLSQ
jgi:hypothetical protein